MFYTLELCDTKRAYEAVPAKEIEWDLSTVSSTLKENGYEVITNTDVIAIVQKKYKLHIYRHGKMKVDGCTKEEAKQEADAVYTLLGF